MNQLRITNARMIEEDMQLRPEHCQSQHSAADSVPYAEQFEELFRKANDLRGLEWPNTTSVQERMPGRFGRTGNRW